MVRSMVSSEVVSNNNKSCERTGLQQTKSQHLRPPPTYYSDSNVMNATTPTHIESNALPKEHMACSKPLGSPPRRGNAHTLFKLCSTVKSDIQGYIANRYKALLRTTNETKKPTGTKLVYHLSLEDTGEDEYVLSPSMQDLVATYCDEEDDDCLWNDATCLHSGTALPKEHQYGGFVEADDQDNISVLATTVDEEYHTTAIKPSPDAHNNVAHDEDLRKARLSRSHNTTSLAEIMMTVDNNDAPLSDVLESDSDSDEDIASLVQKIEYKFASLAKARDTNASLLDVTPKEDPSTPPNRTKASRQTSVAPPDTIVDIALPSQVDCTRRRSGLRRHGRLSLAHLISQANDDDFDTDDDFESFHHSGLVFPSPSPSTPLSSSLSSEFSSTSGLRVCLDPIFPGHSPCHHHVQRKFGRSAASALKSFRFRFECVQSAGENNGYCKWWRDMKNTPGVEQGLVHGGSWLQWEIKFTDEENEEDEELEIAISSSILEDVDGSVVSYGDEPDASGFLDESEVDNVDAVDSDSEPETSRSEVYSSHFVEDIGEYGAHNTAGDIVDASDHELGLATPLQQITAANEVMHDLYNSFDVLIARHVEQTRHNEIVIANRTRFDLFDNAPQDLETSSTDLGYLHSDHPTLRVRVATSSDTMAGQSSIHTSVLISLFSARTSITSKSSYESIRDIYSQLLDALGLEIDVHKCQGSCSVCATSLRGFSVANIARSAISARQTAGLARNGKRVMSLPADAFRNICPGDSNHDSTAFVAKLQEPDMYLSPEYLDDDLGEPNWELIDEDGDNYQEFEQMMDEEITRLHMQSSAADFRSTQYTELYVPDDTHRPMYPVPTAEGEIQDDNTPDAADDPELGHDWITHNAPRQSRRGLWTNKMKQKFERVPDKALESARHCIEASRKMSKTVRKFVPATLGMRSMFDPVKGLVKSSVW